MKKTLKERFEQRSLLFLFAMMLSINMFIFVCLFLINQYLLGFFESAIPLTLVMIILFITPYVITIRQRSYNRLSQVIKDDIFLMGFSLSFITVGIIVMALILLNVIPT